jgi:hypothetical protein
MPANTVIKLRNGTAAEWTAANPVLAVGEIGIEIDTDLQKIGDGTTAWTALTYSNVLPSDSRLSDTRTPSASSITDAMIATTLSPSKITGTAVITTDTRLSNARTPTAHAASHTTSGGDTLTLAQSQISGLPDALTARPVPGSTGIPFLMAASTIPAFTGNASVTFPVGRFTQTPVITVTMASSTSVTSATVAGASSTGFTIYAWAGGSAATLSRTAYYQAVQMTSSSGNG